ncbi:MAG: endolytic transglycosylase MltG [Candidatus Saccharibacteria bacterium]
MLDSRSRFKPQPIHGIRTGLRHYKIPKMKDIFKKSGIFIAIAIVLSIAALIFWYNIQLSPLSHNLGQLKKITIEPGSNSSQIGKYLEKQSIIRSSFAFEFYTRVKGKNSILQAGTYRLSPAESIPQIVEHFVKGNVDQFSITFYPGATLIDNTDALEAKKQDARTILKRADYTDEEIDAAFRVSNMGPLFAGKPQGNGLEGYIYGETYKFNTGATVEKILQTVFDEFFNNIEKNNLIEKFASHGLSLYEGIILASIVQKEATNPEDQKQIAQVFYSRLNQGMVLGSDVTYQYIADKEGRPRDTRYDSPYNTRRYSGLPPGPISNPGLSALFAVADPAPGDYYYFVSDSSGKIYFARTEAEHQANIANYCKENCITP